MAASAPTFAAGHRTGGQTADRQTADRQTADRQTADRQTADRQTGDRQTADRHTGGSRTLGSRPSDGPAWCPPVRPSAAPVAGGAVAGSAVVHVGRAVAVGRRLPGPVGSGVPDVTVIA
jgi:hypothetical protein